jgi:hypothetical protein
MAKTGNNIIVLARYYYNFELPYHVKSLPVLTNLELVTLNANSSHDRGVQNYNNILLKQLCYSQSLP